MKILFIQESDWFKRGPHNQHHIAERLSLRGHDIRVIDHDILWRTTKNGGLLSHRQIVKDVNRILSEARITVIRPGFVRLQLFDYLSLICTHRKEIRQQLKEFKPDVIVGFGILNSWLAANGVKRTSIPFIYYWIDLLHELIPFKSLRPLGRIFERSALRKSDTVIATNKRLRNQIITMGSDPEQTRVLSFGIEPDKFTPSLDSSITRKQYGIQEDDVVLFFVGMINHPTGILDVAQELADQDNPHLKLLCVGDGQNENDLRQIQKNRSLEQRLIITGRQPYSEIPGLIATADVCLLPFHNIELMRDIVPLKLFDYMAMGKPVVSTRLPGIVEEFGDDAGIIYVDKPQDIIMKALDLINSGMAKDLGMKGRKYVEHRTWDAITDEFESIIKQAIVRKHSRKSI